MDFLGLELSSHGIKPQPRLTEAIELYKRPSTRKELRGFLGLAGFYRAFISNFAGISAPLNALTSDNGLFLWTSECKDAFLQLKAKLISEPILKFPDLNQPFFVEVDASNHAVGGILSQKGVSEQLHPLAYFSTALEVITRKNGRRILIRNCRTTMLLKGTTLVVIDESVLYQTRFRGVLLMFSVRV